MAAPVIDSISFDKAVYSKGDTITMTVAYTPDTYSNVGVSVVATGQVSGQSTTGSSNFQVSPPVAALGSVNDTVVFAVSDNASDTWVLVSNTPPSGGVVTQGTAVFTTTAP